MLIGIPPFFASEPSKAQEYIKRGVIRWPIPDKHGFSASPEAQDLVTKLLNKDPDGRLGAVSDAFEVLDHEFFKEVP